MALIDRMLRTTGKSNMQPVHFHQKRLALTASNRWSFMSMNPSGRNLVSSNLNHAFLITILGGIVVVVLSWQTSFSILHSFSVASLRNCDWWDCPEKLPSDQRVFNKSIIYLKPHKTGSETFKEILIQLGEYYDLTTDRKLDWELSGKGKKERRALSRNSADILLRHSRYRKGFTEKRIRGWDDGVFESRVENPTTPRELLRITTTRNPIDRLFSHYFSQRRFKNFTPKRGDTKPGQLSEEEEISDFREWLAQYTPSQQVFYHRDKGAWNGSVVGGEQLLAGVRDVTDFYDHVIVTDEWKLSLCLFGFIERIHPSLLLLRKKNSNQRRARRFRTTTVLADRDLYREILDKIEYDFLLYAALLKKFNEKLLSVEGSELGRYCDRVSALGEEE